MAKGCDLRKTSVDLHQTVENMAYKVMQTDSNLCMIMQILD